ncbi:conjugal transfer protein TraF [Escherichia coli]|uniref:conjugal transfer protein TraF n=1 Tax=Escherichia coli TaxID=562 RepID=UPI00201E511B|nr:conjugal transfer protein TraF [Escherichia coli]
MTRIALAPSKMVLLMSLVITGAHASPEQPLIKDTPFVSGQAYKKGFFWYDDPAKKSEAEEEKVLPPTGAASSPSKEEKVDLNSKWLKENMPRLLKHAMHIPNSKLLISYYSALLLMVDNSTRSPDKSKD